MYTTEKSIMIAFDIRDNFIEGMKENIINEERKLSINMLECGKGYSTLGVAIVEEGKLGH